MSNDVVAVQMSTRFITFNRAQTGFFFRADKTVKTMNIFNIYTCSSAIYLYFFRLGNGGSISGGILFYWRIGF